jgi:hypothetical protein
MLKNVAGSIILTAYDFTTGALKSGDAANITGYVSIDGGATTVLGTSTPSEQNATNDKGGYKFTLAAGETNGDTLRYSGKSSTANVQVVAITVTTTVDRSAPLLGAYPTLGVAEAGTAAAISATSLTLRGAGAAFGTNACAGMTLCAFGSTQGYWQARAVLSNTSGVSGVLAVDAWTVTPSGTVTYILFGTAPISSTGVTVNAASVLAAIGMASGNLDTQLGGIATSASNLQTRVPVALVGGRMDSNVGSANSIVIIGTGVAGDNFRPTGAPPS